MGREEGSGWGTHVYLWRIHFDIWQNQYNIVKLKNKIKKNKCSTFISFIPRYFIFYGAMVNEKFSLIYLPES